MKMAAWAVWSIAGFCVIMVALMVLVDRGHITMDQGNWTLKVLITGWAGWSLKTAVKWVFNRERV